MKTFVAFFDILGFKEFILKNDLIEAKRRMKHILRDTGLALGKGNTSKQNSGIILTDISNSNINCLHISDSIIFWTHDSSLDSFKELLEVTDRFNWQENLHFFPVRGAIVFGEIVNFPYFHRNNKGATYTVNSIFGKAIVNAYNKTESQNWAGCVIDNSVIVELEKETDIETFLSQYAIKYKVPYKKPIDNHDKEYVLCLCKGSLDEESFVNFKNNIENNFSSDNKSITDEGVKLKINNTIKFLEHFKE